MDELLADFIDETNEGLAALETAPMADVCRALHTIKGNARILNLSAVAALAHKAEDIAIPLRDGSTAPRQMERLRDICGQILAFVNDLEISAQARGGLKTWLQRAAQDAAQAEGKKIELIIDGNDSDLARVKDALIHIVRNAAAHGIEPPAGRRAAGKSETGRITLKSLREASHVVIEISDDGRGLPEGDIFKPGFSTAKTISEISGRGIGLDAARAAAEKAGGSIEAKSGKNGGAAFIIRIPL